MAKTYTVLMVAEVSDNAIRETVRKAICDEVSIGGECNFRWTPSKSPMNLDPGQWRATGSAIVDDLQSTYPRLVVKRQEVNAHYAKQLTVFRGFLTERIKQSA
jgi:hypothetical protein